METMHAEDVDEPEVKYFESISPQIEEQTISDPASLYPTVPEKSRETYENNYKRFMAWCKTNDSIEISENSLLMYFNELSVKFKSSTLWSIYSMLKAMILINHNINISNYKRLLTFLKDKSVNYAPQRSLTLTREQVLKFFKEADDDRYLMIKVALIFGICGGCRRKELYNLKEEDIKEVDGNMLVIIVNDARTHQPRTFPVVNDTEVDYISFYKKYAKLRKGKSIASERFFIKYTNKRCYNQVVGINTLGKIPYIIAEYLKLENPELYTGHCFRRSSKTLLADARADVIHKKNNEDTLGIVVEQTSTSISSAPSSPASSFVSAPHNPLNTFADNGQNGCFRFKTLVADARAYVTNKEKQIKYANVTEGSIEYSTTGNDPSSNNQVENIYIKEEPSTAGSSPSRSPSNISLNQMKEINTGSGEIHLHNCTNITININ